jgi:hypothetical protein
VSGTDVAPGSNQVATNEPPRPPLTTTTSIKPAASILLLAVVMLGVFMIINGVADRGVRSPSTTVAVVGGLAVDHASRVLAPCELPGAPPSNIKPSYIVPVGATAVGGVDLRSADPGAYDCSQLLRAPYPQSEILGFYKDQLLARGWALFSRGRAVHGGGEQFLFQKAGSDSFYWIGGVTIERTARHSTSWTLRFYQDNSLD